MNASTNRAASASLVSFDHSARSAFGAHNREAHDFLHQPPPRCCSRNGRPELAASVRSGEISARELVQASLDRIAEVNPKVNAFVDVFADEALAEADGIGADDPRPFAGVPIAIKNNRAVAGKRLTLGSEFAGEFTAPFDHNVVLFVPDGLRALMVNAPTAPAMSALRDRGVNFSNPHALMPTVTTANASASASTTAMPAAAKLLLQAGANANPSAS